MIQSVEFFRDIQTPRCIYRCKKENVDRVKWFLGSYSTFKGTRDFQRIRTSDHDQEKIIVTQQGLQEEALKFLYHPAMTVLQAGCSKRSYSCEPKFSRYRRFHDGGSNTRSSRIACRRMHAAADARPDASAGMPLYQVSSGDLPCCMPNVFRFL